MAVHMAKQFSGNLSAGVWADRVEVGISFLPGEILIDTIYAAGRSEYKLFDILTACKLQQILCASYIYFLVSNWIFN